MDRQSSGVQFDVETDVVVVGAGGCGMVASMASVDMAASVFLLEKTSRVGGTTALSGGLIPAAGTRIQREAGITETPEDMARDIFEKNHYESDPELTRFLCNESKNLVHWLVDTIGIDLRLATDFKYPGHSHFRMHTSPNRTGREVAEQLREAVTKRTNIQLALDYPVRSLITDKEGAVIGVVGGTDQEERVRCRKVILACSGFGASREMLEKYCPEIAHAMQHNHPGSTGEGIRWGMDLGAEVEHMAAFQGYGGVAYPESLTVHWSTMRNGGILINKEGNRFDNETTGYSEYAMSVLKQPEGLAYMLFGEKAHQWALEKVGAFRRVVESGAIRTVSSIEELANLFGINASNLRKTIDSCNVARIRGGDEFGREHFEDELSFPLYCVQVTGAIYHTQGGLKINTRAQPLKPDGTAIPNLYAGGGVAVGVSGSGESGYVPGNGLLAALGWGKIAGEDAARTIAAERVAALG